MPTLSLTSFTRPQATDLISRISTGPRDALGRELEADGSSSIGSVTTDGRYAVFLTEAPNLGADPGSWGGAVIWKDLGTGTVRIVSALAPEAGGAILTACENPAVSSDGRHVIFESDLEDVPGYGAMYSGIFLKDLQTGALTRIDTATPDGQGHQAPAEGFSRDASFTGNGRYVIFQTEADNLVPGTIGGSDNVYRKDLQTGALVLVSARADGGAANKSDDADASYDGRYVVFTSSASDLVAGDTNDRPDIFRKDLVTGEVVRVSTGSRTAQGQEAEANGPSREASISADGRYVVFQSSAGNLVAGDTNGHTDIFRKDLVTGETIRVSTGSGGVQANGECLYADISPDGRYVLFESDATNLDGGDGRDRQVFRKDLQTGEIVRIGSATGAVANDISFHAKFGADGHSILFTSWAGNLVPGDGNDVRDVFRVDNDLLPHRQAIVDGRYVKASFDVGHASGASISWGDGTSESVTPTGGKVSFGHAYATAGVKAATVTVKEGAQTWIVPYQVDIAAGKMGRDTGLHDTLSGGAGGDSLAGDGFGNILAGHAGNDILKGEAGNDVLGGGEGRDRLYGGKGAASQDAFLFDVRLTSKGVASRHKDTIEDFGARYDAIWLDDAAFSNRTIAKALKNKGASLDNPVKMKAGFFKKGAKAADRDDFFIYNDKTKKLYFDADGSGSKAMVEIATIKLEAGAGKLSANDFFFV
ncbi:PD40 domain-containing protein [Microvirga subterranea]|uniref:WD40 repeat protein n=1 Tax=Microvirga subterranea TaxID=186651 RepID=A0A370HVF5_9HYPH|nr:PD40 domain-containing protein [Microvirga subterranea]RDI62290.1 WD40 repeat protein [Microvirga subterranea]